MPHLEHFGLQSYPFGLTPDSDLYYPAPETEAILLAIVYALTRGDGLLKVVGEVGSGKTLLCRLLLKRMEGEGTSFAYINAPIAFKPEQLPAMIVREFGLKPKKDVEPVAQLQDFLLAQHKKNKRSILVIDEAQALGAEGLETVRLLSNLETETQKLLQIVLFGQPELDDLLLRPDMRQVLQRVSFSFTTKPLQAEAVASYVRYRIESCARPRRDTKKRAGKGKIEPTPIMISFTPSATSFLAQVTAGLPRLINLVADKALLAAYGEGVHSVDKRHVRLACRETQGLAFPWSWLRRII